MDTNAIIDAVVSHTLSTGLFERCNKAEPKSAPGNGLSAAVWGGRFGPVRTSGLASTSARLVLVQRLYSSMTQQPVDMIDPNLTAAVDALMSAYSGDFTLGGLIRNVDLLGQHGLALEAVDGYLPQDGKLFRVYTITIPLIINDAWTQAA